jgi:hypothetical protein
MTTHDTHKFELRETVVFSPGSGGSLEIPTRGTITRRLPKEGLYYQYYVQFAPDGQQRMVMESHLRHVT